jgi:hypothetical protein
MTRRMSRNGGKREMGTRTVDKGWDANVKKYNLVAMSNGVLSTPILPASSSIHIKRSFFQESIIDIIILYHLGRRNKTYRFSFPIWSVNLLLVESVLYQGAEMLR